MGTKVINVGDLSAIPLTYATLEGDRDTLTAQLLANISTSGAGDLAADGVDALSYLIFEIIQTSIFINSQDYDIEASAQALLDAQGT
jgi:hypothetical protein|tara:strand:- start:827 stop:1087 length:261 start_codon:yes stop_codon:yes gene_type:complete